jgi:hypothetical protein
VTDRRAILLLCRTARGEAANVADHINALTQLSRHTVHPFNPVDRPDAAALLDLDEFDVVVIHYSIAVAIERYLPAVLRDKIARFRGLKVQFIQDEYRWVDAVTARMRELGIELLYTLVPEQEVPKLYGERVPGMETITTLAGFVPDELVNRVTPPLAERTIDVGYRGRTIPYWLGRLAYEKYAIGKDFLEHAAPHRLRCDIAVGEGDRIYGERWNRFLASCRATLGTESGASIADFDGSIEATVKNYLVRHANATFEEVEREVLAPHEGNVVINVISPRQFEAAALRTAMILYPGDYSGVVEPWTHYIPLAKDFSNMGEVVERLRDLTFLRELTERAHEHLIASGRYSLRRFVLEFDEAVAALSTSWGARAKRAYTSARRRRMVPTPSQLRLRFLAGKVALPFARALVGMRDASVRRLLRLPDKSALAGLTGDLWRLAALRRGARLGHFSALATLEDDGRRLVLTTRSGAGDVDGIPATDVRNALKASRVEEIVWNHSGVSEVVPLLGEDLLPSEIGTHGVPGAYRFSRLADLGRRFPDETFAVLEPLLQQN